MPIIGGSLWLPYATRQSLLPPPRILDLQLLLTLAPIRVSSRIFCLGGKIVCKDQLCVKHAKFLSPFLSINHQCTNKHKARVFITRYCINCQNFLGGKLESLGGRGEANPPHPPVDETLPIGSEREAVCMLVLPSSVYREHA